MFEIIAILAVVLDFLNPFDRHHATGFTMLPHGDATGATWLMRGPADLMARLTQLFVDLDDRIGQGF